MSKKNILWISAIGTLGAVIIGFLSYHTPTSNCGYDMSIYCWMALITLLMAIFIPVFIFSLVSFFINENTFVFWKKFTIFFLFIYWVLILVNPWLPADFSPFEKKGVFIILVPLYFLISLILVIYKSIKLRRK